MSYRHSHQCRTRCQFPQSQLTTINSGTLNPILCCNFQLPTISMLSLLNYLSSHSQLDWGPRYIASGRTEQKTPFPNNLYIVAGVFTYLLPGNGRLLIRLFHSNGCTRYIAPSLRLFVPNGLQAYHYVFSQGCACDFCDRSHLPSVGSVFPRY
jgi:hypothetical protein